MRWKSLECATLVTAVELISMQVRAIVYEVSDDWVGPSDKGGSCQ